MAAPLYREVRLSGSGGQGLVLAGILLAEAAGEREGRYVVQTQNYGPEARGGASRSDVIISDAPIEYPKTRRLDILLCLTRDSLASYLKDLRDDGVCIVDASVAGSAGEADTRLIRVPVLEQTAERLGKPVVANVVALSAIAAVTKVVKFESLLSAVQERIPPALFDINRRALDLGQDLARNLPAR